MRSRLNEKEENCEKIKAEVVFLRKDLEKTYDQLDFGKSTKIVGDILNYQRLCFDQTWLGYNWEQKTYI